MSNKEFIQYNTIRNNAIRLADTILSDEFIPDVIYVSLRGGAYMGNVISECFKFIRRGQRPIFYAAVVARSYTDIREHDQVRVDGWTYSPEHLRTGDRVLLVDDIFDTGRTINHLADIILQRGIPRSDLKIAVHDYKIRDYVAEHQPIQPDYYCRKHEVATPEEDIWIHYLSHEMVGLLPDEIDRNYEDEEVRRILRQLP
jgi:hypoxanthine phosphoribosyltransferase